MAMSPRVRREREKGQELLWHFLLGQRCYFCKKLLVPNAKIKFGNAAAPGIDILEITIHHENGNHSDNRDSNRKLAHQSCHKSHHAKLVFSDYRKGVVGTAGFYGRRSAA